MSRFVPSIALLLTLVVAPMVARADIVPLKQAMHEQSYGDVNAPLTVYEYYSLGCPHCRHFYETTFPEVKKNYVDTGKVRFVLRDFPLGTASLAAAMIARCSGDRYKGMVELFFQSQAEWEQAQNPLEGLKKVARFGGLSGTDVDACLKQKDLLDAVNAEAKNGQDEYGVNATPTFVMDGKAYAGAMSYDEFKKLLDEHLKDKKVGN